MEESNFNVFFMTNSTVKIYSVSSAYSELFDIIDTYLSYDLGSTLDLPKIKQLLSSLSVEELGRFRSYLLSVQSSCVEISKPLFERHPNEFFSSLLALLPLSYALSEFWRNIAFALLALGMLADYFHCSRVNQVRCQKYRVLAALEAEAKEYCDSNYVWHYEI